MARDRHPANGERRIFNRHDPEFGFDQNPKTTPHDDPPPAPAPHGEAESIKWLEDAPARSAEILELLKQPPPDPVPVPPSGGSPFLWPKNTAELRSALQYGADHNFVVMLDPRTHVSLTETIHIQQRANGGTTWGVNGNHAKIDWAGPQGLDMIVYQGVNGVNNRGLTIEKLNLFGNGYDGHVCESCLKLYAPEGDPGCIYKFTLRDIYTNYGTVGIHLAGAVFEGFGENLHGENHRSHGLLLEHLNVGSPTQAIVSNIALVHPNFSRNMGAGIKSVYSVNMIMGSFVLNALGGVVAPDGLRVAMASNGENTGEAVFVLPSNGYGSLILDSEGSTDASTHARAYEGGQWVSKGKPMLYLLDRGDPKTTEGGNHMSTYGNADKSGVRVVK